MSLKQVKYIDQGAKDLVFGYARQLPLQMAISVMINYICLLYYYLVPEKFIYSESNMEISSSEESDGTKNDVVRILKCSADHPSFFNVHGNVIINPKENPNIIATWTIKVGSGQCIIGIHSKYDDYHSYGKWERSKNYGWSGGGLILGTNTYKFDNVDTFGKDDIIRIEMDVGQRTLKFYKNNKITNVMFNDIDIYACYHLMVRINTARAIGSCFKIIDFDFNKYKCLHFHSSQ